jgi:hypothetical protein
MKSKKQIYPARWSLGWWLGGVRPSTLLLLTPLALVLALMLLSLACVLHGWPR